MATNAKNVWVGFDLGGTKMLTIAYDEKWNSVGSEKRKTRGKSKDSDFGVHRIASTIDRLFSKNDLSIDQVAGIGIGCPGPIDLEKGRILTTPNLGWDDVDIKEFLQQRFDVPVVVLNDVDAGVYGEYKFGAAKGARCAVGIFPGTGVGGGCVYDGRILQGSGISCMEIGHTRISSSTRSSGFDLPGTVEAETSRLTIAAEASKAAFRGDAPWLAKEVGTDIADIRSGALADAVANGDEAVKRLIQEAGRVDRLGRRQRRSLTRPRQDHPGWRVDRSDGRAVHHHRQQDGTQKCDVGLQRSLRSCAGKIGRRRQRDGSRRLGTALACRLTRETQIKVRSI